MNGEGISQLLVLTIVEQFFSVEWNYTPYKELSKHLIEVKNKQKVTLVL